MITALNLVHIPKTAGSSMHIALTEKTLKHGGAFMDLFDLMTIRVSGEEPKTVADMERFDKLRFQIAREEKKNTCSSEKLNFLTQNFQRF